MGSRITGNTTGEVFSHCSQLHSDPPTSIPSRFMIVASILRIAVLIERGGGNFVIPILMAFERLWSNTMISLFLFISCCFYLQQSTADYLSVTTVTGFYQSGEDIQNCYSTFFAQTSIMLQCKI